MSRAGTLGRLARACCMTLCVYLNVAQAAEIVRYDSEAFGRPVSIIVFAGPVDPGDDERLAEILTGVQRDRRTAERIMLYSGGGHAMTGIALGRLIRAYNLTTVTSETPSVHGTCNEFVREPQTLVSLVNETCYCHSSCALAWFGGVVRLGRPGFHRAHLDLKGVPLRDHRQEVERVNQALREYFDYLNGPAWLVDHMMQTDRNNVYYLTDENHDNLVFDGIFQDKLITDCGDLSDDPTWGVCFNNVRLDAFLEPDGAPSAPGLRSSPQPQPSTAPPRLSPGEIDYILRNFPAPSPFPAGVPKMPSRRTEPPSRSAPAVSLEGRINRIATLEMLADICPERMHAGPTRLLELADYEWDRAVADFGRNIEGDLREARKRQKALRDRHGAPVWCAETIY
jgi:hypothetical protein